MTTIRSAHGWIGEVQMLPHQTHSLKSVGLGGPGCGSACTNNSCMTPRSTVEPVPEAPEPGPLTATRVTPSRMTKVANHSKTVRRCVNMSGG